MLDDQNYLNQFKIGASFEALKEIFEMDFVSDAPDFCPAKAVFITKKPTRGLQIGLKLLSNPNFSHQTTSKKTDCELVNLEPQANHMLDEWYQLLMVLKTGGVDLHSELVSLKNAWKNLTPTTPTSVNQAKQLALRLTGKIILILHSSDNRELAEWVRHQFEQLAKNLTFTQEISELNYQGWAAQPIAKPFGVIDLVGGTETKATIDLFKAKNQRLSGKMPASYILKPTLETKISQALELMLIAQVSAFYLAAINKQSLTKELF